MGSFWNPAGFTGWLWVSIFIAFVTFGSCVLFLYKLKCFFLLLRFPRTAHKGQPKNRINHLNIYNCHSPKIHFPNQFYHRSSVAAVSIFFVDTAGEDVGILYHSPFSWNVKFYASEGNMDTDFHGWVLNYCVVKICFDFSKGAIQCCTL